MRTWLIPAALVAVVLVGLPVLALTDSRVEQDVRRSLGLNTGECEPATDDSSPWQSGPNLPFDLDEPRATALDGDIYLVGGIVGLEERPDGKLLLEPSDRVMRFDPQSGRYAELAPLPRPLNHIGLVGYDHDLYVLGGYGRTLHTGTGRAFYRYDPDRDRWSRMPDMPVPRAAMAADVVGDELIVAAGALNERPSAATFAFDFKRRRWSRLPDMPNRREHVAAAALDGSLYVVGGRTTESFAVSDAARYDVAQRRWRRLPPLPVPAGGMAMVAGEGSVLVIGGGDDGAGTVTGAVQAWDPAAHRWRLLAGMRTPRHGHAAAVADGKIWVFGGSPCAYFNATDSVEWLPLPKLPG